MRQMSISHCVGSFLAPVALPRNQLLFPGYHSWAWPRSVHQSIRRSVKGSSSSLKGLCVFAGGELSWKRDLRRLQRDPRYARGRLAFFTTDSRADLNVRDKASLRLGLFRRSRKASQDSLTLFTVNGCRNQFYSLLICSNFWRLLLYLPWPSMDYKPWLSLSLSS